MKTSALAQADLAQVDLSRAGATLLRVALGLVPVLIGATWAHVGNGWVFNAPNGGWEYPVFLIVISLVVALQATYGSSRSPSGGGN